MQTESITVVQGEDRADVIKTWTAPGVIADATTEYRILRPDEWPRIEAIFARYRAAAPSPATSSIAVAERDGEIIGFLTLQPMLHVEPIWIAEGRTADVYVPRMLSVLESLLKPLLPDGVHADLFIFSPSPEAGALAKANGFEHQPLHVWHKQIANKENV